MDSSSLLQLQSQRVNQSSEDPKLSVSKALELSCSIPEYDQFNAASESPADKHLMDLLCDPEHSKATGLTLSIPMPNFLIDPQDGQFTPYFDRSPVSTPDQEYDEPMFFPRPNHSRDSSPDSVLSPLRSRATSIALKKLMETQAQMLLDISAAWKKKYPGGVCPGADCPEAAGDKTSVHSAPVQQKPPPAQALALLPPIPILPAAPRARKIRSMSHQSAASLASIVDQLSLRDPDKASLAADVEGWKRDALQARLKDERTRTWIAGLPTAAEFEPPAEPL